jgi:hypothetical protein
MDDVFAYVVVGCYCPFTKFQQKGPHFSKVRVVQAAATAAISWQVYRLYKRFQVLRTVYQW